MNHHRPGRPANQTANVEDTKSDLGFGRVLSEQRELRLLNRNGSFNVQRRGRGLHSFLAYTNLVTTSWTRFLLFVVILYSGLMTIFALAYVACGPGGLVTTIDVGMHSRFLRAFFFSIHTSTTIGYGDTLPVGLAANSLVAIEAVGSLLGLAVMAGLIFARLSRPVADILFSRNAVIAKYGDLRSFQFRIVNQRNTQILDLHAQLLLSRFEPREDGAPVRRYYRLLLEREIVAFFPLSWTVVHVIDEKSPLYGMTEAESLEGGWEFLILLTGMDEAFGQIVHARSSYRGNEVVWDANFGDIFVYDTEGRTAGVDLSRFHDIVRIDRERIGSV